MEQINAVIESTELGYEDHGIFTFNLHLRLDDGIQGFGGYTLDKSCCMDFITSILRVVGVSSWESLNGKYIRVERHDGLITKIGHIIENKWFEPKRFYDEHNSVKSSLY